MSEEKKPPKLDPETREAWDYLMEVLSDYEAHVEKIGDLGYSAPQLLYYRDEVQEFLDELTGNPQINYQGAWKKVSELDQILRERAQDLVDEIGHKNFIQYQIMNEPSKDQWWWWLNRVTAPPPPPPKIWEFWKHSAFQIQEEAKPEATLDPNRDPEIAKLFETPPEVQE